jgi:hypothetical protein
MEVNLAGNTEEVTKLLIERTKELKMSQEKVKQMENILEKYREGAWMANKRYGELEEQI